MPFDPRKLTDYPLFKQFWETPEGSNDGLSHRGLDEVDPRGVDNLLRFALAHELDGATSDPTKQLLDEDERAVIRAILEHPHYGAFFELDARPRMIDKFGLSVAGVKMPATSAHPVDDGAVELKTRVSEYSTTALSAAGVKNLPETFVSEYKSRKKYFEDPKVSAEERGKRTLGLLRDYTNAMWARGQTEDTPIASEQLLQAFEKLPGAQAVLNKDFNGAGWNAAHSLAVGLDPNEFKTKFPDAGPAASTTSLHMDDAMAKPMSYVDEYRAALGLEKKAEAHERAPYLGYMLGQPSGHDKHGSLSESRPFSSSGLNWGLALFPRDQEVANLPPKKDFEFPIDCIDSGQNRVVFRPGDKMEVVDSGGRPVKVEKVIERDTSGKAMSWSCTFKDAQGKLIAPDKVVGLIKDSRGTVKGDGKANGHANMWWYGFCDRNAAQLLYKSARGIPELDREVVNVRAGDRVISVPRDEAQKLIDCDIPDIVQGDSMYGFRFDDEPKDVKLKNGELLTGQLHGLSLSAGPGAERLGEDRVVIHDAPGHPMLGNIEIDMGWGSDFIDVRDIDRVTMGDDGDVVVKTRDSYPGEVVGKPLSSLPWNRAQLIDGKKVIIQDETSPIRGGATLELTNGTKRRLEMGEISQVTGEIERDMSLSGYMAWVSKIGGNYATDASTGEVVSNGMRWVNKIDTRVETGDARPDFAPEGPLYGINGPLIRETGDKMLWSQALYRYDKTDEPNWRNFAGWIQVNKNGRVINEGFTEGQPDFAWGANPNVPLNWNARSSFNPYYPPEMRLALFVNGIKDRTKLEELAKKLNFPRGWRDLLVTEVP